MRTRKKGRQAPDGPPTSLLLFWLFLAFLYCQNGMMIPGCLAQATNTPGDVDESGDNATLGSTTPSTSKCKVKQPCVSIMAMKICVAH